MDGCILEVVDVDQPYLHNQTIYLPLLSLSSADYEFLHLFKVRASAGSFADRPILMRSPFDQSSPGFLLLPPADPIRLSYLMKDSADKLWYVVREVPEYTSGTPLHALEFPLPFFPHCPPLPPRPSRPMGSFSHLAWCVGLLASLLPLSLLLAPQQQSTWVFGKCFLQFSNLQTQYSLSDNYCFFGWGPSDNVCNAAMGVLLSNWYERAWISVSTIYPDPRIRR
ncbi:hypothetical protein F4778DRAFT_362544 [Xylariomycetidae sp. FL2044]|nr:hypothetical protein F4778DRAFT_362544 [Xylariomycetidae sp. FL2044]